MTDWGGDTPWDKDEGEGDAVIARTGSREDDKSRAARVPRQRADGDVMTDVSDFERIETRKGSRGAREPIAYRWQSERRGAALCSAPRSQI